MKPLALVYDAVATVQVAGHQVCSSAELDRFNTMFRVSESIIMTDRAGVQGTSPSIS